MPEPSNQDKEDAGQLSAPTSSDLIRSVQALLVHGRRRDAYTLLQQAVVRHGNDPFLLSYFGYLEASLDGRYRNGIDACLSAIRRYDKMALSGEEDSDEARQSLLYLNLGKAYLAAGKKKDALETFNTGLKFNRQSRELLDQIRKLGIRKVIPVPFLARSNPINEIIGRLLRKKTEPEE